MNASSAAVRLLVLASTSRFRRTLLDAAGIAHTAMAPSFDETHAEPLAPPKLAIAYARAKAESLGARHPDALIIGADQLPEVDGEILTKPGTIARAVEQLERLQGRTHRLHTAVAVHDPRGVGFARTRDRLVTHTMTMRPLSRAQIEAYVARDAPFDCAGAYKIEAAGTLLFSSMEGSDHTAIVGLPLSALTALLCDFGYDPLGA